MFSKTLFLIVISFVLPIQKMFSKPKTIIKSHCFGHFALTRHQGVDHHGRRREYRAGPHRGQVASAWIYPQDFPISKRKIQIVLNVITN